METTSAVFERSPSLVTRDLAGEKIIVPVRGRVGDLNSIYTLNPVANEIWGLLDGKLTIAEIVERLAEQFDVQREVLVADVTRVIEEMHEEGLIRQV
jgi:Coenzyme PQQ synthesis protein D (PqqD)